MTGILPGSGPLFLAAETRSETAKLVDELQRLRAEIVALCDPLRGAA